MTPCSKKVLVSAYACSPGRGSEPEIGWNWVRQLAREHCIWVLTRRKNQQAIEAAFSGSLPQQLHLVYLDLPVYVRFWKAWPGGLYLYYYVWQVLAYFKARQLHNRVAFDIVHHVTFGMYWMPSFVSLLPVRFVWGPVGGGESTPLQFRRLLPLHARVYEFCRSAVQTLSHMDPFVHITARRAEVALATTNETASRLKALGCRKVRVLSNIALASEDLTETAAPGCRARDRFRIFSAGRLLHWKGFHFAIEALARVAEDVPGIEYSIFGSGPERCTLEKLAEDSGVGDLVTFHANVARGDLLRKMSAFDVLIHPSLHDSGGFVCIEAMAAGCPVICLDLGGPAVQVVRGAGIRIPAQSAGQVVHDLAAVLKRLASDHELRKRMSDTAREHARTACSWESKLHSLPDIYGSAAGAPGREPASTLPAEPRPARV